MKKVKIGDSIRFNRIDIVYDQKPNLGKVYSVVNIVGNNVYLTTPNPLWIDFTTRRDISYTVLTFQDYYGAI